MSRTRTSHDDLRKDFIEDELFLTIENLRSELLEVAQKRSFSDLEVLELSQRLDGYIVIAQNRMLEKQRGRSNGKAGYAKGSIGTRVRPSAVLQR